MGSVSAMDPTLAIDSELPGIQRELGRAFQGAESIHASPVLEGPDLSAAAHSHSADGVEFKRPVRSALANNALELNWLRDVLETS